MKRLTHCLAIMLAVIAISSSVKANDFTILHSFTDMPNGGLPLGTLVLSGSTLYGTGSRGPNWDDVLFSINTDGTDYNIVHSFTGSNSPNSINGIVQSESKFYGMSLGGGNVSTGTIFSMNTDGTGYQLLHSFDQGSGDGFQPYDTVAVSGSWLYGTTCIGGTSSGFGNGTVFKMKTDGTNYQILHAFTDGSDGTMPYGTVTVSGSTLYGMSSTSVYSMNTDGTDFKALISTVGGFGDLILNGSILYGVGQNEIFSINTDGTGLKFLHTLESQSQSGLALIGSTLYGTTLHGGVADKGTVFSINTDGTDYQILHEFIGGATDGSYPVMGDLIFTSTALYGVTNRGGTDDCGVVYSIPIPEPSAIFLIGIGLISLLVYSWRRQAA